MTVYDGDDEQDDGGGAGDDDDEGNGDMCVIHSENAQSSWNVCPPRRIMFLIPPTTLLYN